MVLKVCSPDQVEQRHLETCEKCRFWGLNLLVEERARF